MSLSNRRTIIEGKSEVLREKEGTNFKLTNNEEGKNRAN